MKKLPLGILLASVIQISTENIAFAEPPPSTQPAGPRTADGNPVTIEELGITINPLADWEISHNNLGMSLILQAPKSTEIICDKITYRPNLTVVAVHEPRPIDELTAKELKEDLKETISKGSGVKNIEIDEQHRFFDYRGTSDGLIIYSAFTFGDAKMRQIHTFVSGDKKQFHLTYTDLAEELEKDQVFENAWKMISSFQVTGEAPARFESLKLGIGVLILITACFSVLFYKRRRDFNRALNDFQDEPDSSEDTFSSSTPLKSHNSRDSWNLKSKDLPRTRVSRRSDISNM